jgi:hypothetical protein
MSTSRDAIIAMLSPIAETLAAVEQKFVFVGGTVVPFYITDPQITEFRPTKDVDVIVEAISRNRMDYVEEALRRNGFQNDPDIIHRFVLGDTLLDVLPAESRDLETLNRWYRITFDTSQPMLIAPGISIETPTAACFLATKLEAFSRRGGGDFLGSRDIEDVISIIDGRDSIVEEIHLSPLPVRGFLAAAMRSMSGMSGFHDCVEGNLSRKKPREQARAVIVERITRIAQLEH